MIAILIVIIAIIIIYTLVIYNKLVRLNNKIKDATSTIDVYLNKRYELIPNLVRVVKGYATYESSTLEKITEQRAYSEDDLKQIFAIAEKYPDLKASTNYIALAKELTKVEDEIANARKYYSGAVKQYNQIIEMFPSSLVAKIFRFKTKDMYEASENSRENIKVDIKD